MDTIGIIDDDEDSGLYLSALLEDQYKVKFYKSWKEAKYPFRSSPPSLIILDISMPDMKGNEVIKEIRAISELAHINIVAFTAYALPEDREKFLNQGFNGYFAKPITDIENFLYSIRKFLN